MMHRSRESTRGRASAWAALVGVVVVVLAACEGGTLLEGELLHPPPELTVDRAATSSLVHAGTNARIRVRAEGRTSGIAALRVRWTGPISGEFTRTYPSEPMAVVLDTTIAVPPGAVGDLVFTVTATSAAGIQSAPAEAVVRVLGPDVDPPEVSVTSIIPDRVERDDSLTVAVRCRDLGEVGQLAWCGYTVRFIGPGGQVATVVRRDTVPARDTAAIHEVLPLQGFDPLALPVELDIEVHGFAIDAAGNCGAGVTVAWSSESCIGTEGIIADVEDPATTVTVVAATTINREWGGTIEELAVDAVRGLVFGSVIDRNRIEVLDFIGPRTEARRPDILVGSRPAGITLDRTGDTLIVANSGGTSLSFVDLNTRQERSRLETPNAALYTLPPCTGGETAPIVFWQDFGDRPLRVAQDRDGVIMYSTTAGGPIRMVEHNPGWSVREANIMLWSDVVAPSPGSWAVTYVDSMVVRPENVYACDPLVDRVTIYDHVPGHPSQRISATSTVANFAQAITSLRQQGSDILAFQDSAWAVDYWNVGREARFAASRDRSTIAIADGSRAWTWRAKGARPGLHDRVVSWYLSIDDLSNNLELGINGIAVDQQGRQFAARGGSSIVYFDDLLRLHGSHEFGTLTGDAGVALHPTARLAFAPTNDRSVLVLETGGHYQQVAELPLVRTLMGPVHFSARRGNDPPTLVGRVHGLDGDGNVVTVPVWQRDVQ
jgi:DNA-binding beta-propeller fold protein YncE